MTKVPHEPIGRVVTADQEGAKGRSTDEPFTDYYAALEYADRHNLELVCAGTRTFEKRQRTLPPGAFEVHTYRSKKGLKTCGMFSRQFARVERERRLLRLFVEAPLKK